MRLIASIATLFVIASIQGCSEDKGNSNTKTVSAAYDAAISTTELTADQKKAIAAGAALNEADFNTAATSVVKERLKKKESAATITEEDFEVVKTWKGEELTNLVKGLVAQMRTAVTTKAAELTPTAPISGGQKANLKSKSKSNPSKSKKPAAEGEEDLEETA